MVHGAVEVERIGVVDVRYRTFPFIIPRSLRRQPDGVRWNKQLNFDLAISKAGGALLISLGTCIECSGSNTAVGLSP